MEAKCTNSILMVEISAVDRTWRQAMLEYLANPLTGNSWAV